MLLLLYNNSKVVIIYLKIGDKISFDLYGYELTSKWDTPFGITYLYTFKDIYQNAYVWKTRIYIVDDIKRVTARIKDFIQYNDTKETVLSYCKFK